MNTNLQIATEAKMILIKVCNATDTNIEAVLSVSRKRELVEARFIAVDMVWEKMKKDFSGANVGSWFFPGSKVSPHAMVVYATKRVSEWLETNKEFRGKYFMCRNLVFETLNFDAIPQL